MPLYLATPIGEGPWPGVVVVSEPSADDARRRILSFFSTHEEPCLTSC